MPYNDTLLINNTNIAGMYEAVNTASSGLLSIIMILVVMVIVFMSIKQTYDTLTAFLSSSALGTIISILFFAAGYISLYIVMFPILLLMFSVLVIIFSK